jgi:hypothetical protein
MKEAESIVPSDHTSNTTNVEPIVHYPTVLSQGPSSPAIPACTRHHAGADFRTWSIDIHAWPAIAPWQELRQ